MDKELSTSFRLDDQITLRTFVESDAQTIFDTVLKNRDHLQAFMHWMTPDYSLDSAKDFIVRAKKGLVERTSTSFAIFHGDKFIGSIGFVYFDWKARKTEIGYWIAKEEEGKGLITRLCQLIIRYAFDDLDMNRVEIRCAADNMRSAAVPQRLGFKKEGTHRQAEFRNGELRDFNIYGLLATDPRLW